MKDQGGYSSTNISPFAVSLMRNMGSSALCQARANYLYVVDNAQGSS
jgi:hypothetical protein